MLAGELARPTGSEVIENKEQEIYGNVKSMNRKGYRRDFCTSI